MYGITIKGDVHMLIKRYLDSLVVVQITFILLKLFDAIYWPWDAIVVPTYMMIFSIIAYVIFMVAFKAWRNK